MPHLSQQIRTLGLAVFLVVGLAACDDGPTGSETAHLTVALTDAPLAMFEEARVQIGKISLIPAGGAGGEGDGGGGPVVLTESGGEHDLLDLQNGVMADLAELDIAPGTYAQLRLEVVSAEVTLAEGYEFATAPTRTRDLFVPSGAQTGIKVNLRYADGEEGSAGIQIAAGETVLVVLDMDVSRNFVLQGDPDGLQGVLFTPLVRATVEDVAGSISGTIRYESATPETEAERATVSADLLSSTVLEEMQTVNVTTQAFEDGTYTLWFLAPGTYDVQASATIGDTEYTSAVEEVTVEEGEAVEGIDLTL